MVSCFVIPCLLISALGADEKLVPRARVDSGGEVVSAQLSPDGARLVGTVRDGKQHDLVVWNLPSGSRSVLLKGFDLGLGNFRLSPDGKSLVGVVLRMRGGDSCDLDVVVWDAPDMSKTVLRQAKGTQRWLWRTAPSRRIRASSLSRTAWRGRSASGSAARRRNGAC